MADIREDFEIGLQTRKPNSATTQGLSTEALSALLYQHFRNWQPELNSAWKAIPRVGDRVMAHHDMSFQRLSFCFTRLHGSAMTGGGVVITGGERPQTPR